MKPEDNKPDIDNLSVDEKISLFLKKFANKNTSPNTYNEQEFGGGHRSGGGDFYDSNELDRLNIREYFGGDGIDSNVRDLVELRVTAGGLRPLAHISI